MLSKIWRQHRCRSTLIKAQKYLIQVSLYVRIRKRIFLEKIKTHQKILIFICLDIRWNFIWFIVWIGWISGFKTGLIFCVGDFANSKKNGTDSVNYAGTKDIQIWIKFPGNPILKFLLEFWIFVGEIHMRRCFIFKITYCVNLVIAVNLIRGN